MLRLDCPFCGLRDHDEFSYLEDGSVTMPSVSDTSEQAWFEAVFLRDNPRGKHVELWHHVNGCRMVLRVERDTQTHIISKVEAAHPAWRNSAGQAGKPARKPKTKAAK